LRLGGFRPEAVTNQEVIFRRLLVWKKVNRRKRKRRENAALQMRKKKEALSRPTPKNQKVIEVFLANCRGIGKQGELPGFNLF
jgi:hypothetical protein